MLVRKTEHERLEREHRRHVADDVGKHRGIEGENVTIGEMKGLHGADHVTRRLLRWREIETPCR